MSEVKGAQKQELEQITLPPEVVPKVEEKVPLPKKEFAGLSLGEILGAGLGISTNTPLNNIQKFIDKIMDMVVAEYHWTINNFSGMSPANWASIIKSIDGGVGALDLSPTYHRLVEEAKEAFVPYAKAIAFDGVNLVADLGLIAATKGKYRKAFMVKAGVDAGLLAKDAFLYWYTGKTIRDLFLSIQKGSPYENWNALFETGKYILFNKIFPYLDKAEALGKLQLPINIAVSFGVGILAVVGAYRSEKKKVKEYATDVV